MKRWMTVPMDKLTSIPSEWHSVHLEGDMTFVGVSNLDQHQIAELLKIPNITILPPIMSASAIGQDMATLLTVYGVLATDTTYETVEKVIAGSGLHQLGLGET